MKKVRQLWEMMNGWVYKGFNASYARMGLILISVSMKAIPIF